MFKSKQIIIIFIWLPFVFSLLLALFFFFKKCPSVKEGNLFDLSNFEKILSINLPDLSENLSKDVKIHKYNWNPFLGKTINNLAVNKKVLKKKLYLSAILTGKNRKACIVNGRIYPLNAMIDSIKIVQISSNYVVLNFLNGKKVVLHVGEQIFY